MKRHRAPSSPRLRNIASSLPIWAAMSAVALFSCSDQVSTTAPYGVDESVEQATSGDPVLGEIGTQPTVPGKGLDDLDPRVEPLPDLDLFPPIDIPVGVTPTDVMPPMVDGGTYTPDLTGSGAVDPGITISPIDGRVGGVVERGIFRLDVPRGATDGEVEFQVEVPDNGSIQVNLYPHGIQFDEPVILTLDLSDAEGLGENVSLFWWNDKLEHWENVGGTFDAKTKTLTCPLQHFSTYSPGRAGWSSGGSGKEQGTDKEDNKTKK